MLLTKGTVTLLIDDPDLGEDYLFSLDSQKTMTDQKLVLMKQREEVNDQQVNLSFSNVCQETFEALTTFYKSFQGQEIETDHLGECLLISLEGIKQSRNQRWDFKLVVQQLDTTDLIVTGEDTVGCCS